MRAFAIVALCSCAPNLRALAEHRHYREAICGAHDGSRKDRDAIGAALDADAGIAIHAHAVTLAELSRVLGDSATAIAERARFVRVEVQTNTLPIDDLTLGIELADHATSAPIASRVGWEWLAAITGETLPPKRRVTTFAPSLGNLFRALSAVGTLGILPLGAAMVGHPYTFDRAVEEIDAPDFEYAKQAPRAYALFHAMDEHGCTRGSRDGYCSTWFLAMDRSLHTAAAELQLTVRYLAKRADDREPPCVIERVTRIGLGDTGELDTTLAQRFRSRMRTLDDLQGSSVAPAP
jgi:hypothetical protein